jgi:hypothetical protein
LFIGTMRFSNELDATARNVSYAAHPSENGWLKRTLSAEFAVFCWHSTKPAANKHNFMRVPQLK